MKDEINKHSCINVPQQICDSLSLLVLLYLHDLNYIRCFERVNQLFVIVVHADESVFLLLVLHVYMYNFIYYTTTLYVIQSL